MINFGITFLYKITSILGRRLNWPVQEAGMQLKLNTINNYSNSIFFFIQNNTTRNLKHNIGVRCLKLKKSWETLLVAILIQPV